MKKSREKRSVIWSIPTQEFQEILDASSSIVEILKKLKLDGYNGNHRTIKKRINQENFDTSKFDINSKILKGQHFKNHKKKIPDSEVFVKSDKFKNGTDLKLRLLNLGWEEKCKECGIGNTYNNKPISLQLDHINGCNTDNRLENLQLLCPNCHSQTETFSGKRHKIVYNCQCGNEITKESVWCKSCAAKKIKRKNKIQWPSPEELQKMLFEIPTVQIAETLGVSDVAISKYAKKHNLKKPERGYWTVRR